MHCGDTKNRFSLSKTVGGQRWTHGIKVQIPIQFAVEGDDSEPMNWKRLQIDV